tara:strand:- start:734 stop:925 length:192 start_codon:yes stop_codon:yes gene_type:complete
MKDSNESIKIVDLDGAKKLAELKTGLKVISTTVEDGVITMQTEGTIKSVDVKISFSAGDDNEG